ncbi:MAG: dihydroorotase [Gammaproteobacteria bacterium]|nr:dihydroorotase [Gammaproteobacteria bacterium]
MKSILITNARIVNEGRSQSLDVYIRNGRIEQLDADLSWRTVDTVIDASGKVLLPGMIDDQVHFRDPGLTHKADFHTESRAALAGGITSFMDMPNTRPQTVTLQALEQKYAQAAQKSVANYAFYLGATNDNLDVIRALDHAAACGIKVFMGASTGNMLVDDPKVLEQIFIHAPTLIATHCEDTPMISANEHRYREQYGDDVPVRYHPSIRSAEACYKSSSFAVELAREHDTRLHVLHLSTAGELKLFSTEPLERKRITAEACVHHLYFDESAYAEKGTLIKCNPAIKTRQDREALIQAVREGRIDVIGTDHAPHTKEEKDNTYFKAPSGLPLVQHALPALLELFHDNRFSLELIVEKTSHAVARCFGIKERGYIREGYWADLVLVDLDDAFTVDRQDVLYKCGWSPFEGISFRSRVDTVLVSGQVAYQQGSFVENVKGRRLDFDQRS